MTRNALVPALLVSMAASFLAGCTGDNTGTEAHLIAVIPKTGSFEVKGPLHEDAIRMALEELVDAGAHDQMDRTFNVIPVNSGDGADVVEDLVQQTVDELGDDVLGIISSTGSAHEGSSIVALREGIPHFETSSGAHDEEFLDWSKYSEDELAFLMSSRALCNYEAIRTAEFIMQRWPTATLALFRGDKEHDKMHTRVIRDTLREMGFLGTVLESNDPNLAGETWEDNKQDYLVSYDALETGGVEAEIRDVVENNDVDVVFFHVRGDAINTRFVQDTQRSGYDQYILTCGMARKDTFIDPNENGLISDYLVGKDGGVPDNRFFFVMRGSLPSTVLDGFKRDYGNVYDAEPDTFTPSVYDAAMLWGLGVLHAKKLTRPAVLTGIQDVSRVGTEHSRDDLAAMVAAAAAGEDVDFVGASGPMDVRTDRTVPGSYYVEQIIKKNGSYAYEELADPPRVLF